MPLIANTCRDRDRERARERAIEKKYVNILQFIYNFIAWTEEFPNGK